MSEPKILRMSFNDEYVGKVYLWEDGELQAEFVENNVGASCVAFLVAFAIRQMLTGGHLVGDFNMSLN